MEMSKRKIENAAEELGNWMLSETPDFNRFTLTLLASLPLDEKTTDDIEETTGVQKLNFVGWKESELLEKMLHTIDNPSDGRIFWNKLKKVV